MTHAILWCSILMFIRSATNVVGDLIETALKEGRKP